MSSDVIWHIRDKLWPMPKHGSIKATYVRCMRVLAVTCHLHFWQNDRDFLRATAVTRGWNGYRNKSQHRKSTLEKKVLPPFQQGFEPATFQSRVRCSNHWAIPAPYSRNCHTLIIWAHTVTFTLKIESHFFFFRMTFWLMVVHHNTKFSYERLQTNTQPSGNKYVSWVLHPSPLKTPQCIPFPSKIIQHI